MTSDKIAMAISTFSRLGSGILVFIAMARFLGPAQFGLIAGAMAYAGFLNLVADFGLGAYALREAGAEPERVVDIVRRALIFKAMTTCIAAAVGLVLLIVFSVHETLFQVQILAFLAMTAASLTDLAFVAVRATGLFWTETRCVGWTSAVSLFIVAGTAAETTDVIATSWVFLASRVLYAGAALWALRQWLFFPAAPWPKDLDGLKQMACGAASYAVDSFLTNLSNQVDVVIVTLLLDPLSVGIYQAGARLVQGISPFASILSTVYLPKLALAHRTGNTGYVKYLAGRLNLEFTGLAFLGWFGFLFAGPLWTADVLGPKYESLMALWPGFADFVLFRFTAAAFGIQLAAFGEMRYRIGSQAAAILTVVVGNLVFVPTFGVESACWTLALSSLIPLAVYAMASARESGAHKEVAAALLLVFAIVVYQLASSWPR